MTKKQILERELNGEEWDMYSLYPKNIDDAMEEYAKQECIGFAFFVSNNFELRDILGTVCYISKTENQVFTPEAAYNLYLQQKINS